MRARNIFRLSKEENCFKYSQDRAFNFFVQTFIISNNEFN